ncbi:MAG: c-type cytochrome [Chryseotalea sp. WA131a]|nr:MAG: c-type cytochrome [Chryseotalea sp. WA131a]
MKYFFIIPLMLLGSITRLFAQSVAEASTSIWDDPLLTFYVVVGFIFMLAILVLLVAVYMLRVLNYMNQQAAQERAERLGIPYVPEPTFWEKLWQQSNDFVPVEKEASITLDHNYDGIKELDNHLPPWWTGLFLGTIAFAIVYLLFYHVFNTLPSQQAEYDTEVAIAQEQLKKLQAANPVAAIDETNLEATTDALALAEGKQIFLNTCASCHRKDGGGDIGPNLTDDYWKHGGTIKDIFKTVRHGVQGTNMIAWEGVISPEKMKNVSSYVLTLRGTNPANPKKPEGDLVKPETKPEVKADTVKTQASL